MYPVVDLFSIGFEIKFCLTGASPYYAYRCLLARLPFNEGMVSPRDLIKCKSIVPLRFKLN